MDEIWKDIDGFDGLYLVSNHGRIKSLGRYRVPARILKGSMGGIGYRKVQLFDATGKSYHRYVHHLVLTAFVGPRPEGMEAAHKNGVRHDNRLENLRWDTRSGNHADKRLHGTMCQGETHGRRKLSADDIRAIRSAPGSVYAIARAFGVGAMQVSRIKNRKNWGCLV